MKPDLRPLLRERKLDAVADLAAQRARILASLTSLTFDADPLIAWRAVEAMGQAARRIAHNDPDRVRDHLRRLHWLLNEESGGVCWRAPQALAEIIRQAPGVCGEYIPIVLSLAQELAPEDLARFRPGILWGIGRLGPLVAEQVEPVLCEIVSALGDADPQVRGLAAWCLGQVGRQDLLAKHADLLDDEGPVELYEDGHLKRTRVCDLARQASVT